MAYSFITAYNLSSTNPEIKCNIHIGSNEFALMNLRETLGGPEHVDEGCPIRNGIRYDPKVVLFFRILGGGSVI